MQILDHGVGFWYLLEEKGTYYLDIHCSQGFASFSILIQLTDKESKGYQTGGKTFVDELASSIDCGDKTRHIKGEIEERANAAIYAWLRLKNLS
jgi:hypothetical protein